MLPVSVPAPKIKRNLGVERVLVLVEQVVEQHHVGAAAAEEGAHDFDGKELAAGFAAFEVDEQHRALGWVLRRIVHARAQLLDLGPDAHRLALHGRTPAMAIVYYINDWKSINIGRSKSMAMRPQSGFSDAGGRLFAAAR
jgi:hypothetical protein